MHGMRWINYVKLCVVPKIRLSFFNLCKKALQRLFHSCKFSNFKDILEIEEFGNSQGRARKMAGYIMTGVICFYLGLLWGCCFRASGKKH